MSGSPTAAPPVTSQETLKAAIAAMGSAHRALTSAIKQTDSSRTTALSVEDEALIAANMTLIQQVYGTKVSETLATYVKRGEQGDPCAGSDLPPRLCSDVTELSAGRAP